MRIHALLSWYDESASWLAATVASCAKVCDHIVALDGAFALYPQGRPKSGTEQVNALVETANACGVGLTLVQPQTVWIGNEVEKRTALFRVAESLAEPNVDWYMVMDADQVISDCPADLRQRLEATDLDAAEVTFWERNDPHTTAAKSNASRAFSWPRTHDFNITIFFRAIPGLYVRGNHYTYCTPDERVLWGNASISGHKIEPALDLKDFRVEHRTAFRDKARHDEQYAYYRRRDNLMVELGTCGRCEQNNATGTMPFEWELHPEGLAAGWIEVCADCAPALDAENRKTITDLGFDPDQIHWTKRAA